MTDKIAPGLTLVLMSILAAPTEAQEDTAAASGMTSGLPGVSAARQAELMHVRAQAQKARPEAEAAAMARSAEEALDQKMNERTLEEARVNKELKKKAAYDYQLRKAADAYRGVSQSEINAWGDGTGSIKIQRGVPSQFTASLPPEEEAPEEEEGGRFGILKAPKKAAAATVGGVKKAFSWRPFGGKKKEDDYVEAPAPGPAPVPDPSDYFSATPPEFADPDPADAVEDEKKDGFFSRIPLVGRKKKDKEESIYEEPIAVGSSAEFAATTSTAEEKEKGGFFSKIPLVGRKKKKAAEQELVIQQTPPATVTMTDVNPSNVEPMFGVTPTPPAESLQAAAIEAESDMVEEKDGILAKIPFVGRKKEKTDESPMVADAGSSPFGRGDNPTIDASLFPDSDGAEDEELMAKDLGSQKKKFLKMPKLSGVKVPKIKVPNPVSEEPKPSLPKVDRSGTHAGGSKTYVVQTPNAQFMRFGNSALNSETMTLNSGQVVEMTKAGDEWSSVRLSNGVTGIMRNKDLRPAQPGEGAAASATPGPSPDFATTVP